MLKNLFKILILGPFKGAIYRFLLSVNRGMYPTFLVFQLTKLCNSKCIMCNIWKENAENEMSTRQIQQIFKDSIFRKISAVNLTGGEVFLRKDFVAIVSSLCDLPKLDSIHISTNGISPSLILKKVIAVQRIIENKDVTLSIKVSIDGSAELHDEIRGIDNCFSKCVKTLKNLQGVKDKRINSGISCLIMNKNVKNIDDIYKIFTQLSDNISFTIPTISEGYFQNKDSESDDSLEIKQKNKAKLISFLKFINKKSPEHSFYNTKMIEYIKSGKRTFFCLAGHKTLYMDNHGNIFPCAILSDKESSFCYGNILNENFEKDYFNKKGKNVRNTLKKCKTCNTCIFSCDLRNNLREEFYEFLLFYIKNPVHIYNIAKHIIYKSKNKDFIGY